MMTRMTREIAGVEHLQDGTPTAQGNRNIGTLAGRWRPGKKSAPLIAPNIPFFSFRANPNGMF